MKKIIALFSTSLMLCANLLAVSVGDAAKYVKNQTRTTWLITKATGSLEVVQKRQEGYVVELTYALDVRMRGEQTGTVTIFVPEKIFMQGLYSELQKGAMAFGVFDMKYLGQATAHDANGKMFADCTAVQIFNVDHSFKGANQKARVEKFIHEGKIASVSQLEISLRLHPDAPVLGAVEIDIKGISNFGIGFEAGLDLERKN